MVSHILHESEPHLMPPFLYAAPPLYFLQWLILAKIFLILAPVSIAFPLLEGLLAPLCLADIWACHARWIFRGQCLLELYIEAALFPDHTV